MNARTVSLLIAPLLLALVLAACADPGRATALEAQRDELQERVTTLESTVQELEASLESAEAEREEAQSRVSELETSRAEARATADEATAERDTLRNQVDRLEVIASSLREGQESDLETQLALIEALLSRAQEDVTALTGRQGVLRDRLGLPEATGDADEAETLPGDASEPESESDSAPTSEDVPSDSDEPAPGDDAEPADEPAPGDDAEPAQDDADVTAEDGADEATTDEATTDEESGETEPDQERSPSDEESDTLPLGA